MDCIRSRSCTTICSRNSIKNCGQNCLTAFTYQSSLAEESIKKGLCKTMIKIINNQKTIKSFSLRLVDLNGSVVKTITETQHPVSATIEIPFTEDDYNIMDNLTESLLSMML